MFKCYRYTFPFSKPFHIAGNMFENRSGLIFTLQKDSISAYGEAAPLPGFSIDNLAAVIKKIQEYRTKIEDLFAGEITPAILSELVKEIPAYPSLQFGLLTLGFDYLSKHQEIPLRKLLFRNPREHIALNAILPLGNPDEVVKKADEKWLEGFKTFKLKIGIDFEREKSIIRNIRSRYEESTIRLDANRSWSLEEAGANLCELEKFDIEYCEEPLKNPDVSKLKSLTEMTTVPLALDETICQNPGKSIKKYSAFIPVFIIKPMCIGNFLNFFETNTLLDTHIHTVVFTTTLESGIGRLMTATLASGLGSDKKAHGLDTGSRLKMDVWYDRAYIDNGYFHLPDGYGLGEKHEPKIQSLALDPIDFQT